MIERQLAERLRRSLELFPVLAVVGPRQVGETTLAREKLAGHSGKPAVCLDLERATDRSKLSDAEACLARQAGQLVILDVIQRLPEIFPLLRSHVDERRRASTRRRACRAVPRSRFGLP